MSEFKLTSQETNSQLEFFMPEEIKSNPPTDYELLVGHNRTDGTFKTDYQLKSQYIELTDELIRQMTDGVYSYDTSAGERTLSKPDYVIWLDKSARPVCWLTQELWPLLAKDPITDKTPKQPKHRFVNIDREQWVNTVDPTGSGRMDISLVDESIIRSLRSIFEEPKYKAEGLGDHIDTSPAELDGKTILIIDEVRSSGRTLDIANKFFAKAFPTAKIATSHWMRGTTTVGSRRGGTAEGNADLPVWYQENNVAGRGVGNRDERTSQGSKSLTQRLGGWFLSTQLQYEDPETQQKIQDQLSERLRKEFKQLAQDAKDGKILISPSVLRDDLVERATKLNQCDLEEYKKRKNALEAQIQSK